MLYQAEASADHDRTGGPAPVRTVLVAATPRCGSRMLGQAMATTGLLGVPSDYCSRATLAEWMRRLGTATAEATLAGQMARRTTGNGVFAIKAHFAHCAALGGPFGLFAALPGLKVVHLRRADVLRQAVSYAVARQSGAGIGGQEPAGGAARYDADLLAACLDDIALQNARWVSAFAEAGIEPLNLYHEEVARDLPSAVRAIVRFAGVMPQDGLIDVGAVSRRPGREQRDADWIARYAGDRRSPERRGLLRGLLRG